MQHGRIGEHGQGGVRLRQRLDRSDLLGADRRLSVQRVEPGVQGQRSQQRDVQSDRGRGHADRYAEHLVDLRQKTETVYEGQHDHAYAGEERRAQSKRDRASPEADRAGRERATPRTGQEERRGDERPARRHERQDEPL